VKFQFFISFVTMLIHQDQLDGKKFVILSSVWLASPKHMMFDFMTFGPFQIIHFVSQP
jgi:hypothetical protein